MKLGVGNEHQPFKSLVSYFSYWRRGLQQWGRHNNGLSTYRLYLCDQKQHSRAQIAPPSTQRAQIFWKLQAFSSLQSFKIVTSDRFCQYNCFLDGGRDSWCFLFAIFLEPSLKQFFLKATFHKFQCIAFPLLF